nr:FAD-binding protein [Planococcus glaciei]
MRINQKIKTDVLVVGSGLAGIKVAKELADQGHEVLMATKMKLASGSSFYPLKASLGTQVTKDGSDKPVFMADIETASRGMHRQDLAEIYVEEIAERVQEYGDIGVISKKVGGRAESVFCRTSTGHLSAQQLGRHPGKRYRDFWRLRKVERYGTDHCYFVDPAGRASGRGAPPRPGQ